MTTSGPIRRCVRLHHRGTATIDGLDEHHRHGFSPAFQSEFAVEWLDGEPHVMAPDLICVPDSVSGDAIGTETLRYGQRVRVIALPAPPILLTPKGIGTRSHREGADVLVHRFSVAPS